MAGNQVSPQLTNSHRVGCGGLSAGFRARYGYEKVPSNTLKIRVAAPQTYLIRCRKPWGATTLPKVTLAATVRLLTDYANLVVS